MSENKIPQRGQLPEDFTWNLKDIFDSDQAWTEEYESLDVLSGELAAYQGTLNQSGQRLLDFLRLEDEISMRLGKLLCYASCKSDQDTANSLYRDMRGKAVKRYVALESALAFAAPEIMDIEPQRLEEFFAQTQGLETYRRALYRVRRMKKHILSAAEERLLAAAGEMAESPDNISGVFHNADLKFPDAQDSAGAKHPLTPQTLVPLLESGDRVLRRSAFKNCYDTLGAFRNTAAATLDAQLRQLRFFAGARKYPSTLEAALDANELPVEVYTNLIRAVHGNLDKMYRYVALRKRLLAVEELHMYDVYTPMIGGAAEKISYDRAKDTVLKALSVLGEDYTELLKRGFNERWIDVYENQGKRGGAYSTDSSHPHPYVLLNHKDTLDSMFTIAHEMGHALHSYYSGQGQPPCDENYVIFVAEVASTCNEVLLMRYLLEHSDSKKQRAYLINHFLDQFKGTVYRQTMFAEFELELGKMAQRGETLTADALDEKYLELNKLYFGPDMVSDAEIALEWTRIPHFFYNYYVFQYATGFSAAVAIAQRILSQGAPAVADYKRFLSSGCSADPISLLKIAGVDMADTGPIDSALSLFGELTEELEKLTEEKL